MVRTVTVLLLGLLIGLTVVLVLLRTRWSPREPGQTDPRIERRIDGDPVYSDDRLNELLHARRPQYDEASLDVDPETVETTICGSCDALNRRGYRFCRACGEEL